MSEERVRNSSSKRSPPKRVTFHLVGADDEHHFSTPPLHRPSLRLALRTHARVRGCPNNARFHLLVSALPRVTSFTSPSPQGGVRATRHARRLRGRPANGRPACYPGWPTPHLLRPTLSGPRRRHRGYPRRPTPHVFCCGRSRSCRAARHALPDPRSPRFRPVRDAQPGHALWDPRWRGGPGCRRPAHGRAPDIVCRPRNDAW